MPGDALVMVWRGLLACCCVRDYMMRAFALVAMYEDYVRALSVRTGFLRTGEYVIRLVCRRVVNTHKENPPLHP